MSMVVMVDYKSSNSISDCIFNGNFENASVFDILNEWKIMFDLEYIIENGIIKNIENRLILLVFLLCLCSPSKKKYVILTILAVFLFVF